MHKYTNLGWINLIKYLYQYIISRILQNVMIKQSFYLTLSAILSFNVFNTLNIDMHKNTSNKFAFIISSNFQQKQYKITNNSQKIVIIGIKNNLIKNKLQSFLKTNYYHKLSITQQDVNYWINQLKLSGFFQQVSGRVFIYKKKR